MGNESLLECSYWRDNDDPIKASPSKFFYWLRCSLYTLGWYKDFFLHFLAGMLVYLCGGDMSLCYHATVDTRTLAAMRSLYITLAWFVLHA